MTAPYRIFGAELSPYSVKVRSYFRYKEIPHQWIVRDASSNEEFQKYAKLPLIPLVVTPEGQALQDSTPIIEAMEAEFPEPTIHPSDPALAFLSALLEEFGDEWGNKWMFHFRWAREVDQKSAAERLAKSMMPGLQGEQLEAMSAGIAARMVGRVWFVGSSPQTAPLIEESFADFVTLLDTHLQVRPYLFGGRPAFADFGVWGQIYNAWTDPTAGAIVRRFDAVVAWVERMLTPAGAGAFEGWDTLQQTLQPILRRHVGALFLPWSDANARAIAASAEEFTVALDGREWTQKPQKYHAKSLAEIRNKHSAVAGDAGLRTILEATGCRTWLE
jgi:glutathione S-transferase